MKIKMILFVEILYAFDLNQMTSKWPQKLSLTESAIKFSQYLPRSLRQMLCLFQLSMKIRHFFGTLRDSGTAPEEP